MERFGFQPDEVESHALTSFVLENRGQFFPSLASMQEAVATPESSASIRERLSEVNKEHCHTLRKLYEWEAAQYHEEVAERRACFEDAMPYTETERKRILSDPRMNGHAFETIRYSHLQTVLPLQAKLANMRAMEVGEQRRMDASFPSTISEYRSIRDKQVQLRVARFLMVEDDNQGNTSAIHSKRDQVMDQFGWAWVQVTPLCEEYNRNEAFKAEVHNDVKQVEMSSDPRRKRL